jgi:cytochrome c551
MRIAGPNPVAYDPAAVRGALLLIAVAATATVAGCGTQGVTVPSTDPTHEGAEIFAQRCSGCHTLSAAGTEGSANRSERQQGPNLNQRQETMADVIYAIRNGGFSGAIMPQNIVVGADAQKVAAFVAKYAGQDVVNSPRPATTTTTPGPP